MNEDDIDPKTLVVEAEALISAALHSTDDHRYEQLLAWAREIIAPLVAANYPDALWVECTLTLRHDERITDEQREKRHWEAVRKASEAGCISAKFALACKLDEPATREESARLIAEAAIAGHAQAKWCHGLDLLTGTGIEKNEELGLAYIRESAEQKFEGAISFIVDAYATGTHGYPKDIEESARWRKKLINKDLIGY